MNKVEGKLAYLQKPDTQINQIYQKHFGNQPNSIEMQEQAW